MKKYGKKEITELLDSKGIAYEIREHQAVYTVEEAAALNLPYPEAAAKNLFLRDDKKKNFYLLAARDDASVNLKELRKKIGSRPLSFASPQLLDEILGLIPGSVTPLGILNDEERRVEVLLDSAFEEKRIAMHPNENTATLWMQEEDLAGIVREHGNGYRYVEL